MRPPVAAVQAPEPGQPGPESPPSSYVLATEGKPEGGSGLADKHWSFCSFSARKFVLISSDAGRGSCGQDVRNREIKWRSRHRARLQTASSRRGLFLASVSSEVTAAVERGFLFTAWSPPITGSAVRRDSTVVSVRLSGQTRSSEAVFVFGCWVIFGLRLRRPASLGPDPTGSAGPLIFTVLKTL